MPPRSDHVEQFDEASCSTTSSPLPLERKRRIRFAMEETQIWRIPHIRDFDKELVHAIWFDKQDYDQIKTEIVSILRKMMKGEHIEENDEQTTRGLEYRTRDGAMRRQHNKVEGATAVLDEQDRARNDHEKISDAYRKASSHCIAEAHALAVQDVESIKEYMVDAMKPLVYERQPFIVRKGVNEMDENGRKLLGVNKLLKQMRIRRRSLLNSVQTPPATLAVASKAA